MSVAIAEQKNEYDQFRMTMIDIAERKRAEEKINHLAAIVESSDDAIIGKSWTSEFSVGTREPSKSTAIPPRR